MRLMLINLCCYPNLKSVLVTRKKNRITLILMFCWKIWMDI
uniref:Uncharacterized protein n=1 Tax=Tetranychus urticae TaxID=32264 RepID=T1L4F6_TETUR